MAVRVTVGDAVGRRVRVGVKDAAGLGEDVTVARSGVG